jgi:hypothetical protein
MAAAKLGRLAYATFGMHFGDESPAWDYLPEAVKFAWDAAADAILADINVDAPNGRCGTCFEPMVPLASDPRLAMCPVHRPEGLR